MDELSRDLLVAVLAVLTDAIPRPGLAAALKTWSLKRDQPLAEVLKEATGLDDERLRALECLAAAHLKTHHDDLRLSLQALNAQEIAQCALTELDDADLRTTISATVGCEATMPMDQSQSVDKAIEFLSGPATGAVDGRFQLIRPHAQGGIGQVWLARDSELQREVAVKEIQPRFAGREDQRARFVLEAEITGNLEHPGIVPVYSLGRNAEGRPYYAMRFIRGESLSVEIQRFHKKFSDEAQAEGAHDGKTAKRAKAVLGSKWGVEFRQLIGRFLDVCDAIAYAHSRGVIHRDLKPANIMVGAYGETLVVDWGLAKKIGVAEAPRSGTGAPVEPEVDAASETMPEGTQEGTTIGTPAYMSPEQARGLIEQLGPASDVYSLGASLYELVTGKAPFHERKISAVLAKVIAGDFPAPRALDRSIHAALEAICLKAMAKVPGERYPTVRALAQDLEHWLADEPTAAYPESKVEKMTRWFRRHRAVTVAAAGALLAISTFAVIAAAVIEGSRRGEETARKEAEVNFAMAQQAVEDYLTNVSENTLLNMQDSLDMRKLRQDLLQSALHYYQKFASERKNDPLLRQQLAKAYFRVGQITREIDSRTEAMGAFRSAQGIWESLAAEHPQQHELAGSLAECYLAMGKLQSIEGNFQGALQTLSRARTIVERLAQENGNEPRFQSILADCYYETGIALSKLENPVESLAIHEKARAIQQGLIDRYRDNLAYKKGLAENLNAIGFAQYKRQDINEALKTFEQVQETCEALMSQVSSGPKPAWLLNLLALALSNIGNIHKQNGEIEEAVPFFEKAIKYRSDLADLQPTVTQFREKLGVSYREIAELQHKTHQDEKAFPSIRKSIEVYSRLAQSHPETASFHSELAWSWDDLGILLDDVRKNTEATDAYQHAVSEQELAIAKTKDAELLERNLCYYLDNLGEQFLDVGRPQEALPRYERALDIRRRLSRDHPESSEFRVDAVKAQIALGSIRRHLGDAAAAKELFSDASAKLEAPLGAAPGDSALRVLRAIALAKQAAVLADLGELSAARPLLIEAAEVFRQVADRVAPAYVLARERERRSETLWDLARVLRDSKELQEAARIDDERSNLWKSRPPAELADLALQHLNQATLIGYGKTQLSTGGQAVRELDLNQAANELVSAIKLGFKDRAKFKSVPESTYLLSRADVESALKDLASLDPEPGSHPQKKQGAP